MAKGISAAISTNAGSSSSAVDASRNPPGWKQNQLQKQSSETRSSDCESFSWYWHGSWTLACTANHGNINIGSSDTWHMIYMIRNFSLRESWGGCNSWERNVHEYQILSISNFHEAEFPYKPRQYLHPHWGPHPMRSRRFSTTSLLFRTPPNLQADWVIPPLVLGPSENQIKSVPKQLEHECYHRFGHVYKTNGRPQK